MALGRPALDPLTPNAATLAALHAAAELREEPLQLQLHTAAGGGLQVTVLLPHNGVARVRVWL